MGLPIYNNSYSIILNQIYLSLRKGSRLPLTSNVLEGIVLMKSPDFFKGVFDESLNGYSFQKLSELHHNVDGLEEALAEIRQFGIKHLGTKSYVPFGYTIHNLEIISQPLISTDSFPYEQCLKTIHYIQILNDIVKS